MKILTTSQLVDCLHVAGLRSGDAVMVHSNILKLGFPEFGKATYLDGFEMILGSEGCIVVPAFFDGFPVAKKFDSEKEKASKYGILTEWVRISSEAVRGWHPFCSLAMIGKPEYRPNLIDNPDPSVLSHSGQYNFMIRNNFKLVFLGLDQLAASIIHQVEADFEVPYRRWLTFYGEVFHSGCWSLRRADMFVRDRTENKIINFGRLTYWLLDAGVVTTCELNDHEVCVVNMADYYSVVAQELERDVMCLVD